MIVKKGHRLFTKARLKDGFGNDIPYAFSFNTKTKRVGMYLPIVGNKNRVLVDSKKVVKIYTYLKDARLFNKETGKEIK